MDFKLLLYILKEESKNHQFGWEISCKTLRGTTAKMLFDNYNIKEKFIIYINKGKFAIDSYEVYELYKTGKRKSLIEKG